MAKKIVTVIIPNYNYSQYLGQCLQSVLDADIDPDKMEIIVVDDASTDESVKLIEEMMKSSRFPFRLIKNETNLGLILSRNRGIANARGEFLFFLDSDNYIRKDCLKIHAAVLQQNPDATACYAPIQDFMNKTGEYCGLRSNRPFDYQKLLEGPGIDAMAMFRKNALVEAGMYDNKMPTYGWEDYELWLRLGKQKKQIIFIEGEPLSYYRVHQLNKSQNYKPDQYNHLVYYLKQKYPVKLNLHLSNTLDSLIHHKNHYAQLFYQTQDAGFNEQNSIKVEITENPFHFKIPGKKIFTALRFDPLNDYVVIKLLSIRFFITGKEIFINSNNTSNASVVESKTFYFSTDDPNIKIVFEKELQIDEVVIEVEYLKTGNEIIEELDRIIKLRSEKLHAQLSKKSEEPKELRNNLNQKTQECQNEMNDLQRQNAGLREELATIKNSFSSKTGKRLLLIHPGYLFRRINEKLRQRKGLRLILKSGFFDKDYYLQNNPDVRDSGMNAVKHFLLYGGVEGRNPSEKFDAVHYLKTYSDVKTAGMNPLFHFIKFGKNEGRQPVKPVSAPNIKNQAKNEVFQEHTLSYPENLIVKNPQKLKSFFLENNGYTEFINKYFDRIYVINLRRRQNKYNEIVQKLKRLNISAEITEAVDGYKSPHLDEYEVYKNTPMNPEYAHPEELKLNDKLIYSPGVWGHLKSNRLILKDALAKGYEKILILEDDVMFMKNFHHEFGKFTGTIAVKNWKFLYLGATQASWDIPGCIIYTDKSIKTYQSGMPLYHPVSTVGSFALAIHRSQFESIIHKIDEMNCPFDWIYKLWFNQLSEQCFVAQPNLIIANMADSDNRPKEDSNVEKMLAITRRKWDLSKYD